MHAADRQDTCQDIRFCLGIRLMEHSLIALACCPGLIRIDARNDHKTVRNFFLYLCKAVCVFAYSVFVVSRTGTYDDEKLIGFPCDHIADQLVAPGFYLRHFFGHRFQCFDYIRGRQLSDKCKTHCIFPLCLDFMMRDQMSRLTNYNTEKRDCRYFCVKSPSTSFS